MQYTILGPLAVTRDGRPVRITGSRERALLVRFLMDPGRVLSVDRLVEDLWDADPPPTANVSIRTRVSRLRRMLGEDVIATQPPGYLFRLRAEDELDLPRFVALHARGRDELARGDAVAAAATLASALGLWHGDALADVRDLGFARATAARLDESRISCAEAKVEAGLALGRHDELAEELESLTHAHPYRERLWWQRMLALYRAGRQADALSAFADVRRLLAEELGLDVSPELRRLEAAILTQAPDLDHMGQLRVPPADAPSGRLTVLLCEIDNAAGLWGAAPTAMWDACRRFGEIVGSCAAGAGGPSAVRGEGHVRTVAVADAAAAVSCAAAVLRAVAAESWPLPVDVLVRAAIDTGTAEPTDDAYVGAAVSGCERLRAAAHGGQVLVSADAAQELRGRMPEGFELVDLGPHRLEDLAPAEHVHQLNGPGLAAAFPALRSLDRYPHNLPVELTSFVGRTREIDEVTELLGTARVLTITGTAGTGKTRLALRASAGIGERVADGVWLAELAPASDETGVARAVAEAIGVAADPGRTIQQALVEHLRGRSVLLLLDGCEHVLDACASFVHRTVTACPGVTVLATSREAVGVPGEVVYKLGPLSCPPSNVPVHADEFEATRLFRERAEHADPSFEPADAASIAQICLRLDGIPLAIELAAAHVGTMTPAQIAERLDDRFSLLTGGPRALLPRQQTLRGAIDWSYELLRPDERTLFDRASVFVDGFTADAAAEVCSGDDLHADAIPGLLASLADRSLLHADDAATPARYRMLESVRAYAAERLASSGASQAVRARHTTRYVRLAHEMHDITLISGADATLRAEVAEVPAALRWSVDHDPEAALLAGAGLAFQWRATGRSGEIAAWLREALEAAPDASPNVRVYALAHLGQLEIFRGEWDAAEATLRAGIAEGNATGEVRRAGYARYHLGVLFAQRGDLDDADTILGDLLSSVASVDAVLEMQALVGLAMVAEKRGRHRLAAERLERALDLASVHGPEDNVYRLRSNIAYMRLMQGSLDEADTLFEQVLDAARSFGDLETETRTLRGLSQIAHERDDDMTAIELGERALEIARRLGGVQDEASALIVLAESAHELGDPAAVDRIDHAIALLRPIGDRPLLGVALVHRAAIVASGDPDGAERLLEEASGLTAELGDVDLERSILAVRAQIDAARAQIGPMLTCLARELEIVERQARPPTRTRVLRRGAALLEGFELAELAGALRAAAQDVSFPLDVLARTIERAAYGS